jgi:adenylate cyclase
MSIWASSATSKTFDREQQHQHACLAAISARKAVSKFNESNPEQALPTSFGLDSGEIVMGHVGALDHYEYRAIGDIVNTASRIEGVNKLLGTQIILSESVLNGTKGLLTRELGYFKLAGKTRAVRLYELLGQLADQSESEQTLIDTFADGLAKFQAQDWQAAYAYFNSNQDDGPSIFYAALCQQYLQHAPVHFDGAIELTKK